MDIEKAVKSFLSLAGGLTATFFKQYGLLLALVTAAVALDFATGVIKAKATGTGLDSKIARRGFWRKIALFVALAFGIFLDLMAATLFVEAGIEFDLNMPFALIISSYITINECISIAENLYLINPHCLPAAIAKLLSVAKSDLNDK